MLIRGNGREHPSMRRAPTCRRRCSGDWPRRRSWWQRSFPAADAPLLVPRLAALLCTPPPTREPAPPGEDLLGQLCRPKVHRPALAHALGGALAHRLGLSARRGRHVPAFLRLAALRDLAHL